MLGTARQDLQLESQSRVFAWKMEFWDSNKTLSNARQFCLTTPKGRPSTAIILPSFSGIGNGVMLTLES